MKRHRLDVIEKLLFILMYQKVFTLDTLDAIRKNFQESDLDQFDDFLLSEGLVTEEQLLKALSSLYQVPSFDVVDHFFDTALLHKFPKDFLLRHAMIPLEDDENTLIMVASDPSDQDLLSGIGKFVSYDIQFFVGIRIQICDAVKEFYDKALTVGVAQDIYDEPENIEKDAAELREAKDIEEAIIKEGLEDITAEQEEELTESD